MRQLALLLAALSLCCTPVPPAAPELVVSRAPNVGTAPQAGTLTLSTPGLWLDHGVWFAKAGKAIPLLAQLGGSPLPPGALEVIATARSATGQVLDSRTMAWTPAGYRTDLSTAGVGEGPVYLEAAARDSGGDSWTSAPFAVTLDGTPPRVTLRLPSRLSSPLPRDFAFEATVDADDGSGSGVAAFELAGSGVPETSTAIWPVHVQSLFPGPGVEGKARVAGLDLRLDPGPGGGLGGTFTLVASAVDNVGNVGTDSLPIEVTRLRWRLDGPAFSTAPILARTGRVLAGDATGQLWAVDPGGTAAWNRRLAAGPLVATPAIWERAPAEEVVFVPTLEGRVEARRVTDGSAVAGFQGLTGAPLPTAAAIDGAAGRLAVAAADGAIHVLDARTGAPRSSLAPPPANRSATTAVSLQGPLGLAGRADGSLLLFDLSSPGPATSLLGTLEVPGGLAARNADPAAFARGAIWLSGWSGVFTVPDVTGGAAVLGPEASPAGPLSLGLAVDGAGAIFAAGDRGLAQLLPDGAPGWTLALAAPAVSPPTVGADGLVYLATADGQLAAVSPGGAVLWSAPLAPAGSPLSAAMIDPCRRTLYVTRRGTLWALAVDSAGLDVRAGAWPHFRHDYQGTGNAQTAGAVACSP